MNLKRSLPQSIFLALALAVPLGALAQTYPSTPAPSPTPSATPTISPAPSPSAAPSATPAGSPTPLPTPLVLPPDAVPQILAVTVNETVFHSGDTIYSTVVTSTNVAAVELRVAGKAIRFPRVDFGVWQLAYTLPHIPRRMLHDYPGQIVAMNSAGVTTARPVTISLR
jgi:hypothetical protein